MRSVFAGCVLGAVVLASACNGSSTQTESTTTTSTTVTSTTSSVPPSSPTASGTTVQVFFLDEAAFNIGRPPYIRAVERTIDAGAPAKGALQALFAGPTSDEAAGGLRFVASEATGFTDLRIVDGTAHVQLVGGCSSGGSTFTVAEEITATLRQFTTVDNVKIYDTAGETERPDEPGDSIPVCLEP